MFRKKDEPHELRKYLPTKMYSVLLLLVTTYLAVVGGFVLIQGFNPFLLAGMGAILPLIVGIVFLEFFIRITVSHNRICYRKGLRKPIELIAGTVTGVDLYTGMIRDGISQRAAVVLRVSTADGKRHELEITPFTTRERMDVVMDMVSIASGARLGSDVLEMMNGEDRTVNKKADKAALMLAIPLLLVLIVQLVVRYYF